MSPPGWAGGQGVLISYMRLAKARSRRSPKSSDIVYEAGEGAVAPVAKISRHRVRGRRKTRWRRHLVIAIRGSARSASGSVTRLPGSSSCAFRALCPLGSLGAPSFFGLQAVHAGWVTGAAISSAGPVFLVSAAIGCAIWLTLVVRGCRRRGPEGSSALRSSSRAGRLLRSLRFFRFVRLAFLFFLFCSSLFPFVAFFAFLPLCAFGVLVLLLVGFGVPFGYPVAVCCVFCRSCRFLCLYTFLMKIRAKK